MTQASAIIPVRELKSTKNRLKTTLPESGRALLTTALLENLVSRLETSVIQRIIIVASNPKEVQQCSDYSKKLSIISESRKHGGVNSAMTDGIERLTEEGVHGPLLLLPTDLPLITSDVLNRSVQFLRDESYEMVINGSERRDGTNLLGFADSRSIPIKLSYDENSFNAHVEEAHAAGLRLVETDLPEISFDVDSPDDYIRLLAHFRVPGLQELVEALSPLAPKATENFARQFPQRAQRQV